MTARTLIALLVVPICLILPVEAGAVTCDGPASAANSGAPDVLTGCGDATVAQIAPALGIDRGDLSRMDVAETPSGRVVRLQQEVDGIPVFNGQVAVRFDEAGEIDMVQSSAIPAPQLSTTPLISATDAIGAAGLAPSSAELVVYPAADGPILAWHLERASDAQNSIVDAQSGAVVHSWDGIVDVDAAASAFDPNPVQTSGNTALLDGTPESTTPDAQRVPVTLTNLTSAGTVSGDFAAPTVQNVAPGTYSRADLQSRFEVVNVYYAITEAQKAIQALGFTDVNNRAIGYTVNLLADDNSNYNTATKALTFGAGGVDDAEDSEVVLHEYGHSIQDNQVPGFGSGDEQGAMGEGFGDFFAGMYYLDKGSASHAAARRYCIADWDAVSYNPVVGATDGSGCLRWIDGTDESDGSDIGKYSNTPTEVHDDGRYWSAGMTCIFEGLGGNIAARDKALRLVIDSHQNLVPVADNTAFEKQIAAMIVSDQNLYSGNDVALIQNCAAERGLATAAETAPKDTTPPDVTAVVDPASPNGPDGFYTGNVSVSWTVTDPQSPVAKTGCDPVTINKDTSAAGTILTCTATSAGGMTSKSVTIKRRAAAGDDKAPKTTIGKHPRKRTSRHRARFQFKSNDDDSSFECSLDGDKFSKCSSPEKVKVKTGEHTFSVRATDAAGNVEKDAASFTWTVKPRKRRG